MSRSFHDYDERPIRPQEVAVIRFLAAHAARPVRLPPDLDALTVFVLKGDEASGYVDLVDWNRLPLPSHPRMACFTLYTDSDGETIEVMLFVVPDGTPISLEFHKLNGTDLVTYPRPEDLQLRPEVLRR